MDLEGIRKKMEALEPMRLGTHSTYAFECDPRHLTFRLARYKFVAKMFCGYRSVLEIGCADGFGTTLIAQAVERVVGIDMEEHELEHPVENRWLRERAEFRYHDILAGPVEEEFQGVFSLDVIEHIEEDEEDRLMENLVRSNAAGGALILGTPNATAAEYASEEGKIVHVNLKTFDQLRELAGRFYRHVFMFGMNDEVLHTGYGPMCHYLFALAVEPKK